MASKAYALLCEAMRQSGKVGVGKVVLREREDAVIIAPHENGLILYRLRYPREVRDINEVPQLDQLPGTEPEQLKLALHLMETMSTTLESIDIRDRYNEALREIIEAKIQGREVVTAEEETRPVAGHNDGAQGEHRPRPVEAAADGEGDRQGREAGSAGRG